MDKKILKEQLKNKKAFIFDMDGTILDLEELNHKGYAGTIKKFFNIELDNDDYQKFFSGTRTAEAFEGFLKSKKICDYDVDELISDFRKEKRNNLKTKPDEVVFLKKGILQLLDLLKRSDYSTCLATSTVKEFVDIILKHFNLEAFFDVVLTADDVTNGKPSPQIYDTAIKRLGVAKNNAVVFEDSKNGISSAQKANIFCVGILTAGLNDNYVYDADYVIKDFEEIIAGVGQNQWSKSEILDIVNKKDEIIGTASREECHSNPNLIYHTVHFTLIDRKKKKVFLTQRSLKKDSDAGLYCFLGEHILAGESYSDAVKRGVKEELGLVPKSFAELAHNIFSQQTQTEFVRFFIVDWNGEDIKWDEREIEKVLWVDICELTQAKFDFSEKTRYWIDNIDWEKEWI